MVYLRTMNKKYYGLELEEVLQLVASYTNFSLGRNYVIEEEILFHPIMIKLNNHRVKEALMFVRKYDAMPFYGIKDIRDNLKRVGKGISLTPSEFYDIYQHIYGAKAMIAYMKKIEEPSFYIKELVDTLHMDLTVANKIEQCFSPYGDILDSASKELKRLRMELNKVESQIQQVASKFVREHEKSVQDGIISSRNNRVVILMKNTDKNSYGGFVHDESASRLTSYVEPSILVPLNNRKQSIMYQIEDEIKRIIIEVTNLVSPHASDFLNNLDTMAVLDAIFAKAQYGIRHDGILAELSVNNHLYFKEARHPLIDPKKVVSNTYRIEKPYTCLLITGSNTGGKTVTLKILGLFTLMTYLAIPVLCSEAKVPLFDEVYVDLTDDQSISESLSTFSSHLKKLAYILQHVTSKSFVLLDELATGTDPKEGQALAIAILNYLRKKQCLTAITTHYGQLKNYGKAHFDILLASVQFNHDTLEPTYKFAEGLLGQSNALSIAGKYGIDQEIVTDAYRIMDEEVTYQDQLISNLEKELVENQILKDELVQQQQRLDEQAKDLAHQLKLIELKRQQVLDKAKQEADVLMKEKQEEANALLEKLKQQQNSLKLHEVIQLQKEIEQLEEDTVEENWQEEVELKVNDFVKLKQSNQVGQILSINRKNVIVNINGMKVSTKIDQLLPSKAPIKKQEVHRSANKVQRQVTSFSLECNLIGMRVEEALMTLSKYLDDAIIQKASSVLIIHGVGSGILRNAIQTYLKQQKHVASFEMASVYQGGAGATVVSLK